MVATTSLEAYEAVKPRLQELHQRILAELEVGGATASELSDRLRTFLKTVTNRIVELKALGLVVNTGDTRKNPRGRSETVIRKVMES